MTNETKSRFDEIADLLTETDKFQLAMTRLLLEQANDNDSLKVIRLLHNGKSALHDSVESYIDSHSLTRQAAVLCSVYLVCIVAGLVTVSHLGLSSFIGLASLVVVVLVVFLLAYAGFVWLVQRRRRIQLRSLLPGLAKHAETTEQQAIQRVVQKHGDALAPYGLPTDVKRWTMREYLIAHLALS